jgi:DNA-damage-inducible protein J
MNTKNTAIQIRVDAKTKREARKTLDELGLDMSSAVTLFLKNVVLTQSIPLNLRTANGFTIAQEQAFIAETDEAKRSGRKYATVDALMADLER